MRYFMCQNKSFSPVSKELFAHFVRSPNRRIYVGADAQPFGTLPSATSYIRQPLGEIASIINMTFLYSIR